jgi:hypothetical protein
MKTIYPVKDRRSQLFLYSLPRLMSHLLALIVLVACTTIPSGAQVSAPSRVGSQGYINGTALTAHTAAGFNTVGASTLVLFVSTDSPWNSQPVSISGVSDNLGNSWKVLTGPTSWTGSQYGQQSAIYYVNVPATSATHTVTVQLTNPAPLVMHIFAASGTDITGPPVYSAITDPGTGATLATVTTAPITVPADTLLLSWVKNETAATATALDGYTLDQIGSTTYLWDETQTALSAGSYSGDFQYSSSIGWQTAVVGLKPAPVGPVAFNQAVTVSSGTSAAITLTAHSPGGFPLAYSVVSGPTHGSLTGSAPNLTYTPNTSYTGSDAFTFKANDGTGDSNIATVSLTVVAQTTVTGVSPNNGPVAGGTTVTITGTSFATGAAVTFGGAAATNVVVVNSTTITATTPAGNIGVVPVTVMVNGQSGSLTSAFTYIGQPTVTSVSPNNGPTGGGTAVTITGTNFTTGPTVTLGSTAATNVVVVSSTKITATTPAGSAGAVTVKVTNPGGQSGSLANGFTYNATAAISFAQVNSSTPQSPTATVTVSYPAAQTRGDLNVVVVGWNDTSATVQSLKDSAGNVYSLAIGPTSGTALRQSIYYAANIAGGSGNTVTVTFSQAAVYPDVRILEYKGVTKLDVVAGASGSSASANSGAATTMSANELIFGANTVATTTKAAGSGFTKRLITTPDGDIAEDKIVTTTGSNSATATVASGPWVMQMVAFK